MTHEEEPLLEVGVVELALLGVVGSAVELVEVFVGTTVEEVVTELLVTADVKTADVEELPQILGKWIGVDVENVLT